MALVAPPSNDRKRVKVYELKSNDWFDRGTGFCTGQVVNDEARIHVQSEDEPTRTLLETRIARDDGYQKQQDTLIVWTDQNVIDMALSFQEAEGCAAIWEFISEAQARLGGVVNADEGLPDDVIDPMHHVVLPPPELGNLQDVENAMRMANSTAAGRDALTKFVVSDGYIAKLEPLVELAESLESLADLHRLCNIMKILILLNDTAIIEYVVTDEVVLGVVGALEYDPDFPSHKANHRQYLSDESRFKEVVKIEDPNVKRKIHYTYRLQYLKDVVLARILDDPTFSVLNSLIFFHQVDIVQHLQGNLAFLKELFSIFGPQEKDLQRKKDAVIFIQQCCAVAKSLQAAARTQLYQNFITGGLFGVITFALRHEDAAVRVAGTDILVALIDHDSIMMRAQIFKALNEKTRPLTDTLIELLLVETDLGVKAQMADAIKVLLDPIANNNSINETVGRTNAEYLAKIRNSAQNQQQMDPFVQAFYDASITKLFQPLKDLEDRESMDNLSIQEIALYSHLVEVLCFFLRQYWQRSSTVLITGRLSARVAQLLSCPEKHIKLIALKYFRTLLPLPTEKEGNGPTVQNGYHKQIIEQRLFEPILNIVFETMPRDNLLNSACLELFEFLKRQEKLNHFVVHLVENYRDRLESITYVPTFQELILHYDNLVNQPSQPNLDSSFTSADTETPQRSIMNGVGGRWQALREPDAEEEAYFAADDDEDEVATAAPTISAKHLSNGVSSMRPLVSYPDDEDETMDAIATEDTLPSSTDDTQQNHTEPTTPTPPTSTDALGSSPTLPQQTPPKRRREEDDEDEDELNKLSTHNLKRRNSQSSMGPGNVNANSSPNTAQSVNAALLKRKKSFTSGKDGPPKKIAISLAVKSGTPPATSTTTAQAPTASAGDGDGAGGGGSE